MITKLKVEILIEVADSFFRKQGFDPWIWAQEIATSWKRAHPASLRTLCVVHAGMMPLKPFEVTAFLDRLQERADRRAEYLRRQQQSLAS